jgi:WhiB family transcriptional regulator, redox-sensing transcriptional regulator
MALRRDERDDRDEREQVGWQRDAACRGDGAVAFFPPPHFERKDVRLARERVAKTICRSCPVVEQCLDYALKTREPHGVWGGLNEFERQKIAESGGGR